MKKLILVAILIMGMSALAYAEISPTAYSSYPRYYDEQVFGYFQNASGSSISSNMAVVIDTTAGTVAPNQATGSVITTTTTADNCLAVGVTDETIADGKAGKVCIRGPHKCLVNTTGGTLVAGATLSTTTTAGYLSPTGTQKGGVIAVLPTTASAEIHNPDNGIPLENTNLYWVLVNVGRR